MNALEKIGINELQSTLYSILERCKPENEHRFQYEQPYVKRDVLKSLEIVSALKENQKEKE